MPDSNIFRSDLKYSLDIIVSECLPFIHIHLEAYIYACIFMYTHLLLGFLWNIGIFPFQNLRLIDLLKKRKQNPRSNTLPPQVFMAGNARGKKKKQNTKAKRRKIKIFL